MSCLPVIPVTQNPFILFHFIHGLSSLFFLFLVSNLHYLSFLIAGILAPKLIRFFYFLRLTLGAVFNIPKRFNFSPTDPYYNKYNYLPLFYKINQHYIRILKIKYINTVMSVTTEGFIMNINGKKKGISKPLVGKVFLRRLVSIYKRLGS